MMRLLKLIPFVLIFSISISASGYDVETHEEMSEHAARRSVLSQDLLSDIGLAGTVDTVSLSDGSIDGNIIDWVRYGANHEDDTLPIFGSGGFRYLNHFYNPLNGQGYSFLLISGYPSPLWALEDQSACPPLDPLCNPVIDGQDYSLRNARDYLYNGLILPSATDREANLALTFQTLGHVMHLVQDAAQPQHTRNDSHGTGSLYESFTNESLSSLIYEGYPGGNTSVKFSTALSFWHTLPPQINIQAGQGIAEYSNRGFVTFGTNFRFYGGNVITDPNFPSPAYDPETGFNSDIATMKATMPECNVATNLDGALTFYGNTIIDSYTNVTTDFNLYTTTLSIFDADLQLNASGERLFALNRFNFCAAQERLIPRAVGYSAGIIDYFFRGRLEADYAEAQGQLTVTVKNISGPENTLKSGNFELYYDATDGTRKSLAIINGADVDSAGIVDGDSRVITANFPPVGDLDTSKTNPYLLMYKGIVGSEEAVVGKVESVGRRVVAVGYVSDMQLIFTSRDGETWSNVTYSPIIDSGSFAELNGVAGNGSSFVAVGQGNDGPLILRSTDGKTWSQVTGLPTAGFDGYLSGVTSNESLYVAVGYFYDPSIDYEFLLILTSRDGKIWVRTEGSLEPETESSLASVTWNGSIFVAVGEVYDNAYGWAPLILTSSNGTSWSQAALPWVLTETSSNLYAVTYNGSLFVAVGNISPNYVDVPLVLTSPDGVVWSIVAFGDMESSRYLIEVTW